MLLVNYLLRSIATLLGCVLILVPIANAQVTQDIMDRYNRALDGEGPLVNPLFDELEQLVAEYPQDPLVWTYYGATSTLKGRDAWLPWNKLSYTSSGVDYIQQGIDLVRQQSTPTANQPIVAGLPKNHFTLSVAAAVYTALPRFFNSFTRGYDLYITLMNDRDFVQQNFNDSAWVYESAVLAAIEADDLDQATAWLQVMLSKQPQHTSTLVAQNAIADLGSADQ